MSKERGPKRSWRRGATGCCRLSWQPLSARLLRRATGQARRGHGLLFISDDALVVLFWSALTTRNMGNVLALLVSLPLIFFPFPEDVMMHVVPTTSARSRSLRHPVLQDSGNVSEKNITQEEHSTSL